MYLLFFFFFNPPELSGVLHQCHILASEMVHFIHQMQYYITFEVRPLAGATPLPGCKTPMKPKLLRLQHEAVC